MRKLMAASVIIVALCAAQITVTLPPCGLNKQIIFNTGGACAGSPSLLWDNTTLLMTLGLWTLGDFTATRGAPTSAHFGFQPTQANSQGAVDISPSGTNQQSRLTLLNNSDWNNTGGVSLHVTGNVLDFQGFGVGTPTPQVARYTFSPVNPSTLSTNTVATIYATDPAINVQGGLQQPLYTPASSAEPCTTGRFADDANFHYVCTATNTWKRVVLAAF